MKYSLPIVPQLFCHLFIACYYLEQESHFLSSLLTFFKFLLTILQVSSHNLLPPGSLPIPLKSRLHGLILSEILQYCAQSELQHFYCRRGRKDFFSTLLGSPQGLCNTRLINKRKLYKFIYVLHDTGAFIRK